MLDGFTAVGVSARRPFQGTHRGNTDGVCSPTQTPTSFYTENYEFTLMPPISGQYHVLILAPLPMFVLLLPVVRAGVCCHIGSNLLSFSILASFPPCGAAVLLTHLFL